MAEQTPLRRTTKTTVAASAAAGTAQSHTVDIAPFDGTVTAVTFTPDATVTGAATNYRTFTLVNKGQAGAGSTTVASLAFSSGSVVATGFDETAITLSGTPANLTVAAGDVLAWVETVAGTGLSSPGGVVSVVIDRSA